MTEPTPNETEAPGADPFADEPIPEAPPAGDGPATAKGKEWMTQLEAMIAQISTQAAPVARQVGAKAAELAALAAVKAGPVAQRAAELTSDYGQRFAEKAQSVAAELRSQDDPDAAEGTDAPAGTAPDDVDPATPAAEDTRASGL
jgi:hypothetical protein